MEIASQISKKIQSTIANPEFISQHRYSPKAFTRNRKLSFGTVVSTILQLAKRSLQIECNLLGEREMLDPPSKQAFSKARYKIRYTAFKALNDQFLEDVYKNNNRQGLWRGYRLLGVDASTIRLPESEENEEYFGRHNSGGFNKKKDPIIARISEIVELTTGIIVNGDIGPTSQGERALAKSQIETVVELFKSYEQKTLFVFDRGYVSQEWIKMFFSMSSDFIFRVPRNFNTVIDAKIAQGECDCIVNILPSIPPLRLIVRTLPSGEKCVLLTSLTDQDEITATDLMNVYWIRWSGCEEGYKKQKISLELENFSGIGVEPVLQEFFATILIVNLFQLYCREEEGAWDIDNPPSMRINRSVVFGSLRETVFKMVMGDISASEFQERFIKIAKRSKVKVRPGRQYLRIGLKKEKHVFRRVC